MQKLLRFGLERTANSQCEYACMLDEIKMRILSNPSLFILVHVFNFKMELYRIFSRPSGISWLFQKDKIFWTREKQKGTLLLFIMAWKICIFDLQSHFGPPWIICQSQSKWEILLDSCLRRNTLKFIIFHGEFSPLTLMYEVWILSQSEQNRRIHHK